MPLSWKLPRKTARLALGLALVVGFQCAVALVAEAQTVATATREVGGISINASGMLDNVGLDAAGRLRQLRAKSLEQVPQDVQKFTPLRKVSLKALDAALGELAAGKKSLPDVMNYLAGLQRVQYVFVYPQEQDIVIAGPAEGWKVDAKGNLVGVTTGWPIMTLDDLAVSLRSASQAAAGITCSIDPTAEGLSRLQGLVKQLKTIGNPQSTMNAISDALGPQTITVTGVPGDSHFARVLVAADYRMKRLAMNFETAPIANFPSFLQMMQAGKSGMNSMLPRWWLAPEQAALVRDAEGLAWELPTGSVKAMTEEDFVAADGSRQHTGKANPLAQKWADMMTVRYRELAVAEPVFGQLRNCMDLAIVSALVVKENLAQKANCSLPNLMDSGRLTVAQLDVPKQVNSQASVLKKGHNWVISASGGVKILPQESIRQAQTNGDVGKAKTAHQSNRWWWN